MKKIWILCSLCLAFNACEKQGGSGQDGDPYEWLFVKSCINVYFDPDVDLQAVIGVGDHPCIVIGRRNEMNQKMYCAPEYRSQGNEEFLKIAERNGDRSYDREILWLPIVGLTEEAWSCNFKEIRIVCTNAAWDEAHPAGTLLNGLINMEFSSYGEFVKSGYAERDTIWKGGKPMTELSELDLYMISPPVYFYFDSHPATGKYDMEVTLVTTEGEEQVSTCTFDFDAVDAE